MFCSFLTTVFNPNAVHNCVTNYLTTHNILIIVITPCWYLIHHVIPMYPLVIILLVTFQVVVKVTGNPIACCNLVLLSIMYISPTSFIHSSFFAIQISPVMKLKSQKLHLTVNVERFTELNFHYFCKNFNGVEIMNV